MLRRLLNETLTEKNGKTLCPIRLTSLVGFLHYITLSTVAIINHSATISLVDMATGISIIVGVVSAGIGLKNGTEKKDD